MKGSGKRVSSPLKRRGARKPSEAAVGPDAPSADKEYRIGPGHPPREFQFPPGVSGNPRGAKPESKLLRDLRVLFARALNKKVPRGEQAKIITKLEAGFNELASQFAEGDHRARRDVFDFAEKLGIDLTAGRGAGRHVEIRSESELRQALLDRGIPARLLPPIDETSLEPPPDPPLPSDNEEEPNQ